MPWNSTAPLGSVSVKANRTLLQQNTTYIETTMGNSIVGTNTDTTRDHFWNVGTNEDGRHRYIQSVGFTSNAVAPNDVYPALGSGMQTVIFPLATNGEVQWFHKNQDNNNKIYQFIPNFLTGTVATISSSYVTVVAVPDDVYGEIFMFATLPGSNSQRKYRTVTGFFRSSAGLVDAWAIVNSAQDDDTANGLKFANGSDAVGLNIRARSEDASSGLEWNYRITYRAI